MRLPRDRAPNGTDNSGVTTGPDLGLRDVTGEHAAPVGDITGVADLMVLLSDFYGRAMADEHLGPIFVDVAGMDLDEHLPVICDFWATVLFRTGQYKRNTLHPHLRVNALAPLTPCLFHRWLELWTATIDERFRGPNAEYAKVQAGRIAGSMSRRMAEDWTRNVEAAYAAQAAAEPARS